MESNIAQLEYAIRRLESENAELRRDNQNLREKSRDLEYRLAHTISTVGYDPIKGPTYA